MGSFRQRSAAAASVARRRDALVMLCVRTRGRMRSVAPSGLSAALQTRTEFTSGASREPSVPRPPGTARALWYELSLASFAARHLVVLALGRGARAPVRHATDKSKRWGTAIAPHTNRAESGGCPPLLQRLPHHWAPEPRAASATAVGARTPTQ